MLDQRWRAEVERGLRPLGDRLRRAGFTADQITLLGLAASLFTGVAIATGQFGLAAAGLALSGLTDVLDGAVAKSGGTAGPRGAFFDSVADRVSDALVLGGAAWFLAGRDPHLSVLAFAVAGLSFLVSYERSRAEALGLDGRGGLMERAERMFLLGLGLIFGALVPVLWLLAALSAITVVQRFVKVWRQTAPMGAETGARRVARGGWWLTDRPVRTDESRLARWLLSSRPPASDSSRPRWWSASRPAGAAWRARLRRLRGRTRP
jgi:CDP-diacylglycerol--glycerol-3-phosphate 3-phosphatidyltransferase